MLELYCASNGLDFELISDVGSGINYNKNGSRSKKNQKLIEKLKEVANDCSQD